MNKVKKKVKLVFTKTGDKGMSSLANGERRQKDDLIFEVLGMLDEVNCMIGFSISAWGEKLKNEKKFLFDVQDLLFVVGGKVAKAKNVRLSKKQVERIEKEIIRMQEKLSKNWQKKFLYPGGCELASRIDMTRASMRKLERRIVELSRKETINNRVFEVINRLSDYLYVLRCYINQKCGY